MPPNPLERDRQATKAIAVSRPQTLCEQAIDQDGRKVLVSRRHVYISSERTPKI